MGDDRPSVYREGDVWVIRASALGGCMKSLIAAGRGVEAAPTPEWMQKKFDEGHAAEPIIDNWYQANRQTKPLKNCSDYGVFWDDETDQWAFDWPIAPGIIIRGHMDGIHRGPIAGIHVVEYKALGESLYQKPALFPLPNYEWQTSIYAHATGLPVQFVCAVKDENGHLDLTRPMHIDLLKVPARSEQAIRDRALDVVHWIEHRAYGEYPTCDVDQYPCPFYLLHDGEDETPKLEGDELKQMGRLLHARGVTKRLIEDDKERLADVDRKIHELLGDRKTVMAGDTKVTWVTVVKEEKLITPKPYTQKAGVSEYPKITPPKDQSE